MESTSPAWRDTPAGDCLLAIARGNACPAPAPETLAAAWNLAKTNGLAPSMAVYVLGLPPANAPDIVRAEARQTRDFALFRNLQLLGVLKKIQHALEGGGIPWISMKGPVFTEQYAGDISLRLSGDLDVLVRPRDVPLAESILAGIGIASPSPARPFARWLGIRQHEHSYHSQSPRYLVELHWSLASDCYEIVDLDTVFRRSRVAKLDSGAFPVLSPEDALLYAALHALGHRWEHAYHLKTLDWILHETQPGRDGTRLPRSLDWDYVTYAAAKARKTRALLLGLALARDWLGAYLPDQLLRMISSDPALPSLQRLVADNFRGGGPAASSLKTLLFKWRALETTRDRSNLLARAVVKRFVWRR